MGRRRRAEMLERATALATERGAEVVGLGGFTAIVSHGGRDLVGKGPAITSGNTLTSVVAMEAIEEAAAETRLDLGFATAAVVDATGAIGRLVSLMLARRVGTLTLVGNPANPTSADRCRRIAGEVYRLLLSTRFQHSGEQAAGSLARRASPGLLHALAGSAPVRATLERRLGDVVNADASGDNAHLCDAVEGAYREAGFDAADPVPRRC